MDIKTIKTNSMAIAYGKCPVCSKEIQSNPLIIKEGQTDKEVDKIIIEDCEKELKKHIEECKKRYEIV